jgi:hypothetical protein
MEHRVRAHLMDLLADLPEDQRRATERRLRMGGFACE